MDYAGLMRTHIERLHAEGRYRIFADVSRKRGEFPDAVKHKHGGTRPITVWCSNDYLGMGQHPKVIAAMHEAIDRSGAKGGNKGRDAATAAVEMADLLRQVRGG